MRQFFTISNILKSFTDNLSISVFLFNHTTLIVLSVCIFISINSAKAQQAPNNFIVSREDATQLNQNNVPGYGQDYATGNTYDLRFGQIPSGNGQGENLFIDSFDVGGNTYTNINASSSATTPYENVNVNRVDNAQVNYEKITAFYPRSQNPAPTANGDTLYYDTESATSVESFLNTYIANWGTDNLFSNANSATTNNIERVDFTLAQSGVSTTNTNQTGFLLLDRGGNDDYTVAPITGLNPDGTVSSLGSLVTGTAGTVWGDTGEDIFTTVFQSVEIGTPPLLRPSQALSSQTISGSYISFADLDVAAGEYIYGISLFPGDVDNTMDLIGLSDVPLNTSGGNEGGLDYMPGGGLFAADQNTVEIAVDLSIEKSVDEPNPNVGDVVTFTITVNNNGSGDASGVSVEDTVPAGYESITNISNGGSLSGNVITWSGLNIDNGEAIVLSYEAKVIMP